MGEKKLYLYLCDKEYGKRLQRYMNSHRHPGLRVELVTERETFWESREKENHKETYWLTDDVSGSFSDNGARETLWILSDRSDEKRQRIGCVKKAGELVRELMERMGLAEQEEGPSGAPPPGIYGVYSPGEEGSVTAALLAQELGAFANCMYINLREFPCFYEPGASDHKNLGELFFRLEMKDYEGLVRSLQTGYGKAMRLPAVSHYRDLWDVDDADREKFFLRLQQDCNQTYLVVLFNDVRETMPMTGVVTRLFLVSRRGCEETFLSRWKRYEQTENGEASDITSLVVMPDEWRGWIRDMEGRPAEEWLRNEARQVFVKTVTEEVK